MIKMVVFDMAGTTVNENNLVYKTLREAINKHGFQLTLEQVLAEGAGKEKKDAIKTLLSVYANNDSDKIVGEIYSDFIADLAKAYSEADIKPQDHAGELFNALRQRSIKIILNTGYDRHTAASLIKKLNWKKDLEFDELITAEDVVNSRPHPDMIKMAMEVFDLENPEEVAKVGDSIIDIEEGKNAGCGLTVGITTGAHTAGQLLSAHPDFIINDLLELLPLLDRVISPSGHQI